MKDVKRYTVTTFGRLLDSGGELVLFKDHQSKLAALREELASAKRNEHNSEVAYTAAIEKQNELRDRKNSIVDLQQRLTAAEQRDADDLRDAERYRALRKITPCRFKKMQDASVTDGGDVLYFHSDRFDALIDAELLKSTELGASE
jgi:hypothetical protein